MADRAASSPPQSGSWVSGIPPIPLDTSAVASPGCAAAYVFRYIAARAGAYRPGTHERLFFYLTRNSSGSSVDHVANYFSRYGDHLAGRGLHLVVRRVAFRASWVTNWVAAGSGLRGAVMAVDRTVLFPSLGEAGRHALALTWGAPGAPDELVVSDPYPRHDASAARQYAPPASLTPAHDHMNRATLVMHWTGWG